MTRTDNVAIMVALTDYSDAELVLVARQGQPDAFSILFERWFDRVWNVSRNILRDTDLASEATQDTFLLAWKNLDQLRNPEAFGGWILRSSRNRALNKLQKEKRSRSESDDVMSSYQDKGLLNPAGVQPIRGPVESNESQDHQDIVWAASAALGVRDASIMDLHLRHGLDASELADELGVTTNNAHQLLHRLKTKLGDVIGNYLLWRDGQTSCEALRSEIAGAHAFDQSVSKTIKRHQKSCDECSERRAAMVSPGQLFASAPLLVPPLGLKEQMAASLQSQGVPAQLTIHSTTATTQPHSRSQPNIQSTKTSTTSQASSAAKVVASVGAILLALGLGWWLLTNNNSDITEANSPTTAAPDTPAEPSAAGSAGAAGQDQTIEQLPDDDADDGERPPAETSPDPAPSTTTPPRTTTTNEGEPPSKPETKTIPDVVGMLERDAISILEDAGCTVEVQVTFLGRGAPEIGNVIGQTPTAETEVAVDTKVTIIVAKAPLDSIRS